MSDIKLINSKIMFSKLCEQKVKEKEREMKMREGKREEKREKRKERRKIPIVLTLLQNRRMACHHEISGFPVIFK